MTKIMPMMKARTERPKTERMLALLAEAGFADTGRVLAKARKSYTRVYA